jgi:hypothetical protein
MSWSGALVAPAPGLAYVRRAVGGRHGRRPGAIRALRRLRVPDNIARLRRNLPGPVEVAWGEGLLTDFYDQPAQVAFALEALESHFTTTPTWS